MAKSEQQKPDVVLNPKDGQPWAEKDAAEAAMRSGEFGSPDTLKVSTYQGGYAIYKIGDILKSANPASNKPGQAKAKKEQKYFEVQFFPTGSIQDQKQIPLGVDGHIIVVTRGTKVILSENHLGVADSAKHKVFDIQPGKDRQEVGEVSRAPYQVIREATKAEYFNFLKTGNKIRDNDMAAQQAARAVSGAA